MARFTISSVWYLLRRSLAESAHRSSRRPRPQHDVWNGPVEYNTSSYDNSAFGFNALSSNTVGFDNTAVGDSALLSSTSDSVNPNGWGNTAVGSYAVEQNFTDSSGANGNELTALGYRTRPRVTRANRA
jgi:hypothetical protein